MTASLESLDNEGQPIPMDSENVVVRTVAAQRDCGGEYRRHEKSGKSGSQSTGN